MKFKIDISRQGNFLLAVLLSHFIFFGFLCNIHLKSINYGIIFLYQVMLSLSNFSFISTIILFIIVFILVFREQFYEYGIRNSFWLLPVIIFESWIWYWIMYGFDITIIFQFFSRLEGYITILFLLGLILVAAISSAYAKQKYLNYMKQYEQMEVN
ncbi:MAG: hypothetical protein EU547_04060 [Promethearchaeota archaeon]|nr:MAG: hypothetical protein EU547_04060 [Candidatus Lokiarchaeota archaeon]